MVFACGISFWKGNTLAEASQIIGFTKVISHNPDKNGRKVHFEKGKIKKQEVILSQVDLRAVVLGLGKPKARVT
jgi:hypothetical protein